MTAASGPPTFRLGDAARPFGWSTVVADFNTDGRPDVAVADHAGMTAGSYRYRLELSISGQERRDVTFESSRDAITVSVADVDHDDDLDLVVQTPLLGETVAVWLNDGQGHFTAGDAVQALAAARWSSSVSTTEPVGSPAYAEAPAPRVDVAPSGAAACIPTPSTSRFVVLAPLDPRSSLHSSPQIPRAPPALALSSAI